MGKIAFVFAGQGAQHTGMGLELAQVSEAADRVFKAADAIRPDTAKQCFYGSDEALCETKNTQPCMFAVEMAAAAVLNENGIYAEMVAGFSLGELAALTYAQVMDFQTGFRLVCRRGALMQRAAEQYPAVMAAVLRLSTDEVERICSEFQDVYPVNYNSPGQISVSCAEEAAVDFFQAVKAAGGRVIPLKVRGGFHSPFMKPAAAAFAAELEACALALPVIPVFANCTGECYPADIKGLMAKQIASPVRWEQLVRNMIAAGADTFLELGPGNTLCGLIGKIDKGVRTFSVSDQNSLKTALAEVKGC